MPHPHMPSTPSHGPSTPLRGPSRRSALLGLTAAVSLGRASLALAAAPTEQRFVVIILRGAMDGLAAITPYGDPALAALRPELLPPPPGPGPGNNGLLDLGGFFGLHPALTAMHAMYRAGELLPVHAVAGPYRSRSHFEAQDMLESGAEARMTSGWLNRAVLALNAASPPSGVPGASLALSVGVATPLLLRGPARVGAFAPQSFNRPGTDLYAHLLTLNTADPVTGPALAEGLRERGFSTAELAAFAQPGPNTPGAPGPGAPGPGAPGPGTPGYDRNGFPALATAAGHLLAAPAGPRIAALELGGWDTHQYQPTRIATPLRQLDEGLDNLRIALGPAWRNTAVLAVTEFGRTVRSNGTRGTDHGTGTAAFIAGGQVTGGRILANWPGLSPGNLLDNRDLQPTLDLRSLAKGLLTAQFHLPPASLDRIFPDSTRASPTPTLLRT